MKFKMLWLAFLGLTGTACFAQSNFSFTPDKPKPGETITVYYKPAGDLANTLLHVEGEVYEMGSKQRANDLAFVREGEKYKASFTTDTSSNMVYFAFKAGDKKDNNEKNGYYLHLYDGDKVKKGSRISLSMLYQYLGEPAGIESQPDKGLAAMEAEFKEYPESKKANLFSYSRLLMSVKKDEGNSLLQKEIEKLLKSGLKDEQDYDNLSSLYQALKLGEQAKFVTGIKKEKFTEGNWKINEKMQSFMSEKDVEKKEAILAEVKKNMEADKKWEILKPNIPFMRNQIINGYIAKKQWDKVKALAKEIDDKDRLASMYNSIAWKLQESNEELEMSEEFSAFAIQHAKSQWKKPTGTKPDYVTQKQWQKDLEGTYAMYADTYAMVLLKRKQAKKGYEYAKEAAITINNGKNADMNNTYALLAEQVLSAKKLKPEMEKFVKDGKAGNDTKEILKRLYIKEKKSEEGFGDYMMALQQDARLKMLEELKKSMLSDVAPSFALVDINGNKVGMPELKGKVVIVDFWATWCGPCKASFPGMQKMVTKYKDNPDVKFIFVDTWEKVDDKFKNAKDFITANKYTFDVWMDNDDKVVSQFKVEGIPTKFVIDKQGIIRFKSVGFSGSDDKLMQELTAMIDMAANPEAENKKSF